MNIASVKRDLFSSLRADAEYRRAWNVENVYTTVCFQLRALREQRKLSQKAFGKEAKMAQERISILEDPNAETKPTLNTLLRLADAFDVGLDVRFVPYGTVIDRSVKTNLKDLEVASFEDELPELEREIECQAAIHEIESALSNLVNIDVFKKRKPSPGVDIAAAGASGTEQGGQMLRDFAPQGQPELAGAASRVPPHSEQHGALEGAATKWKS